MKRFLWRLLSGELMLDLEIKFTKWKLNREIKMIRKKMNRIKFLKEADPA